MSLGRKEVLRMFEYVKWCRSVGESAFGSCKEVLSKIRRYSEVKLFKISDFLDVKSTLFRTMHFLTISPIILGAQKYLKTVPQFLSTLTDGVSLRRFR